jgi:hypothetical protein
MSRSSDPRVVSWTRWNGVRRQPSDPADTMYDAESTRKVVPPLFVEATELARRAAKPLPPRVIAFVTQLNANPGAVTDEDLNRLQIRGTDTYSRIRLPELLPLVESAIVAQAQAAFPDAPTSQAVVLRWHLLGWTFPPNRPNSVSSP